MVISRLRLLGIPFFSCIFLSVYLYNLHKLAFTRRSQDAATLEDSITHITWNTKPSQLLSNVSNFIKMKAKSVETKLPVDDFQRNKKVFHDGVFQMDSKLNAVNRIVFSNEKHSDLQEKGPDLHDELSNTYGKASNTYGKAWEQDDLYGELARHFPKYKPIFMPHEKDLLFKILHKFTQVCKENNFPYFMSGGTLLGSFRHHDIIPWDDDIDVYVHRIHRDDLYYALYSLEPEYTAYPSGPRIKFYSGKSKKLNKYKWRWPYIDISFYDANATHAYDTSPDFRYLSFPLNTVFPLHLRPLGPIFVNSPKDAYSHLRSMYKTIKCVKYGYSHKLERANGGPIFLDCDKLKDYVGFVHRSPTKGGVLETLKIGDNVIHRIKTEEPEYAITKPYSLELLESFP